MSNDRAPTHVNLAEKLDAFSERWSPKIVARYNDQLVRDAGQWRFRRRVEVPMQFVAGPPPMSDTATGVSAPTMRTAD